MNEKGTPRRRVLLPALVTLVLSAFACAPVGEPSAAPSATSAPAAASPTTATTPVPTCPEATLGTVPLRNENDGYCLLYPEGYSVVVPFVGEICLVPGEPTEMACHNMQAMIEVTSTDGRSTAQAADEALVQLADFPIERSTLSVGGAAAVVLDEYPGVDILRLVFFVHGDRLYRMTFNRGSEPESEDRVKADLLFAALVDSFTFLP